MMDTGTNSEFSIADIAAVIGRRIILFLMLFLSVVGAALVVSMLIPPTYKGSAKLIIDNEPASSVAGNTPLLSADDAYLNTQREIMSSPSTLKAALAAAQDQGYLKDAAYEDIKRKMKIGYIDASHVLEVAYYHKDPKEAAEFANAVVKSFFDYHRKSRTDLVAGSLGAVTRAIDTVKAQMSSLEEKLKTFNNKQDAAYYQSQVPYYVNGILGYQQKNVKSEEDLKRLRDELVKTKAIVRSGDPSLFYPLMPQSGVSDNPEHPTASLASVPWIQDVKSKLAAAESEMASLTVEYTDNNPEVLRLRSRIDGIRSNLNAELKKVVMTYADYYRGSIVYLESVKDANDSERAKYEAQLKEFAAKIQKAVESDIEYVVYVRQYEMLNEVYGAYARRQGELQLLKEQAQVAAFANLRVFEAAATPHQPVSPHLPLNAVVGVVLGFIVAAMGCLIEERKTQSRPLLLKDSYPAASSPSAAPARFDRRGMKRVIKDLTVVYTIPGLPVKKYATTANISGTGICIEIKDLVKNKSDMSLDIQLAHEEYIHPTGKVLWIKPDRKRRLFQTGINFEKMTGYERERLVQHLYGEAGSSAPERT